MIDRARLGRDWLRRCRLDPALGGVVPSEVDHVVHCAVEALSGGDLDERIVAYAQSGGSPAQVLAQLTHLADALVRRVVQDDVAALERTGPVIARLVVAAAEASTEQLHVYALRDNLTGLGNRRAFDLDFEVAVANAAHADSSLVVVLMDLDGLRLANDRGGHEAGDTLIARFGLALSRDMPVAGQRYRWGGDEFALITEMSSPEVVGELESLQASTAVPRFSWGLAVYQDDGSYPSDLVRAADRRLYSQKLSRKASLHELVNAGERTLVVAAAIARRTARRIGLPL